MPDTASIRELRNDTAGVIDRAAATGGQIIITRHGKPVATLQALEPRPWTAVVNELVDSLGAETRDTGLLDDLALDDEQSIDDLSLQRLGRCSSLTPRSSSAHSNVATLPRSKH